MDTGKTSTVDVLVRALVASGARVLVAAFTHAAVDHLLAKILDAGVPARCVARVAAASSSASGKPRGFSTVSRPVSRSIWGLIHAPSLGPVNHLCTSSRDLDTKVARIDSYKVMLK